MVRDIYVFVNDHRPGTLDEFSFGQKDLYPCISHIICWIFPQITTSVAVDHAWYHRDNASSNSRMYCSR